MRRINATDGRAVSDYRAVSYRVFVVDRWWRFSHEHDDDDDDRAGHENGTHAAHAFIDDWRLSSGRDRATGSGGGRAG